jgi:L-ascorbate metabolism protein UlaG (beta-lactamase superfamily)
MQYEKRRGRFVVADHSAGGSIWELIKWQMGNRPAKWPQQLANGNHAAPPERVHGVDLHATWIGHSTVLLQTGGLNILTDPFLSMRASPLSFAGPKRVRKAAFAAHDLPPIDIVLVSHNHYDHLDVPGLRQVLRHHAPLFITPLGNRRYLQRVRREIDCKELDWRKSIEHKNVRITVMPALHWSKRNVHDTNRALWGAFVIETPGGVIYFAGDTGFGDGSTFREIAERFGAPRLSLLPIGAYEPRWFMKSQHMDPGDAVAAHQLLSSGTSIGIHHGTIQLTNEPIDAPTRELQRVMADAGVAPSAFLTPAAGASTIIS